MHFDHLLSATAPPSLLYSSLLAFVLAAAFLPIYIKWLKENEIRQFVREEGPASHAGKSRTPTTGGICFIVAIVVTWLSLSLASGQFDLLSAAALLLAFFCALLGLADDLAKVRRKANAGISASLRLTSEILLGGLFGLALLFYVPQASNIVVPMFGEWQLPGWLFVCLAAFLVAATSNSLNLHDGMDGLAAGTSVLVLVTMAAILASLNKLGLACLALTTVGALLAFLLFNKYPAKIFMGDTGSLFLGGLMAGLTVAGGIVIWFVPLSLIYIGEAISVMLQVVYFKLTKPYKPPEPMRPAALIWLKLTKKLPGEGKRLFRMAPLHHHFEAVLGEKGMPEWQVVAAFWFVQLAISAVVLTTFYLL